MQVHKLLLAFFFLLLHLYIATCVLPTVQAVHLVLAGGKVCSHRFRGVLTKLYCKCPRQLFFSSKPRLILLSFFFDVCVHTKTVKLYVLQESAVIGRNVYGVLRAGRSLGTECIILSVPLLEEGRNRHGIAVMLTLAKYFQSELTEVAMMLNFQSNGCGCYKLF